MNAQKKWFPESAFSNDIKPKSVVALQTQHEAMAYLRELLTNPNCVRVLVGPEQSGKSTIVQQFVSALRNNVLVANIDGSGMTAEKLLTTALVNFGYRTDLNCADDLLRMLNILLVQQTRAGEAPILVVENIEGMQPAALRALCMIASLRHQGQSAARIILTGDRRALRLLNASGMTVIAERVESIREVKPLTRREATVYLQGRLAASGIEQPDSVLPMNVCDRIYDASDGFPGALNKVALGTLEQTIAFPVTEADVDKYEELRRQAGSKPKIIMTLNGKVVEEYEFKERKVTIGRSNLADIVIHNEYASKFHALLLHHTDALVLVDLNSANGTYVNSVKVSSTILKSDDIVSLATYRIKILNAPEPDTARETPSIKDTATMKTLEDAREERETKFKFPSGWKKFNQ